MGPNTIVRDVHSLLPGQLMISTPMASNAPINSSPPYPSPGTPGRWVRVCLGANQKSKIKNQNRIPPPALLESVRLHLLADVPLAVFLSGGVDSSAVANLAQKASDHPINTFTLAFEEQSLNEGPYARAISQAIGSNHHEVMLREADFVDNLDRAIESLDQPTFDGLNSFFISQAVRQAGFTVALVGTGGDELFGGYTTFRDLPQLARWTMNGRVVPKGLVRLLRKALSTRHRLRGAFEPQTRWAKLPDMLANSGDLIALYQLAYALYLPHTQRQLLTEAVPDDGVSFGLPPEMLQRLRYETAGRSPLSAISLLEHRCFLGERLLRDTDAASMAVSLETRLPLVDSVLFQHVDALPDDLRYQPIRHKSLLRQVGLEGLDPALFNRPKSGFVLPFDRWIRQNLGQTMDQTMRDPQAAASVGLHPPTVAHLWQAFQSGSRGMYWSRVWAIYILIRWCHRHNVTI